MRIISQHCIEFESLITTCEISTTRYIFEGIICADVCPLADSPSQATKPLSSKNIYDLVRQILVYSWYHC